MAFPTDVNDQITDAVTQTNTKVVGEAPAEATGGFVTATKQALQNAEHNAEEAIKQTNLTGQAATTQGINTLLEVDTAAEGKATEEILLY